MADHTSPIGRRLHASALAALAAIALCFGTSPASAAALPAPTRAGHPAVVPPVQFEPNLGQAATEVRYTARASGADIEIFDDGLAIRDAASPRRKVRLRFTGADTQAAPQGAGRFDTREATGAHSNFLLGADASRWVRNVPAYRQLRYAGLYPGIDLVYYSRDDELEYDLVVRPGADAARIRLQVAGAQRPRIGPDGELQLDGPAGRMRLRKPVLYQHVDGEKKLLQGRYVLLAANEVGFALPAYDRSRPLIIDPTFALLQSTYVGGVHDEQVGAMTLDAQGNAYVIGNSGSEDWPVTGNAYQPRRKAIGTYVRNVVVAKFDAAGKLVYSTFLGGSTNDYGTGIAVDAAGRAYLTGYTASTDFPVTAGAFQATAAGAQSAYLAVLSPDGSALAYATLYGGSSGASASAIALDASGAAVIAGSAGPGLPTTAGAYKTTLATGSAAFVAKFDVSAAGSAQLLAASYYGVDNPQANSLATGNTAFALALDAGGAPWIAGQAYTINLPLSAGALQGAPAAMDTGCSVGAAALNSFAYVARLTADLKTLAYASYLSGRTTTGAGVSQACSEYAHALQIDAAGAVYVGGATASPAFPTTAGAAQPKYPGVGGFNAYSSFVTKLKADGSAILWSSYLGGNGGRTYLSTLALDATAGTLWAATTTAAGSNFPLSSDAPQKSFGGGDYDAGVTQLDAASGKLRHSSLLGGSGSDGALAIAADGGGNVFVAGTTTSGNFPVTAHALQPALTANAFDGGDWFVSVLGGGAVGSVRPASAGNSGDTRITLGAAGIQAGATARLVGVGGATIDALAAATPAGSRTAFTFPLKGAPAGPYDVVVSNPDGLTLTKKAGFSVQSGSGPALAVDLVGRPAIRVGVASTYTVTVTNGGDSDAYFAVAVVDLPPSLDARFKLGALPPAFRGDKTDYTAVTGSATIDGVARTPLVFPYVPAGGSASVDVEVTAPKENPDLQLRATLLPTAVATRAELQAMFDQAKLSSTGREGPTAYVGGGREGLLAAPAGLKCGTTIALTVIGVAAGVWIGGGVARAVLVGATFNILLATIVNSAIDNNGMGYGLDAIVMHGAQAAVGSLSKPANLIVNGFSFFNDCASLWNSAVHGLKALTGIDPNDIYGPLGDGSKDHYIGVGQPLNYTVAFENLKTASLPAARVVVTNPLDADKLDLGSLTLGSITIGRTTIEVPPGLRSYAVVHPIDATISVRIQGSLDPDSGLLKWTFDTLDPATRMPPSDPTLGFLPPDKDGIVGQAFVRYSVRPRGTPKAGTAIANRAAIVFDANAPIDTPTWVNTYDTTAPRSRVQSLTPKAGTDDFEVAWSASDKGSSVRRYTVYVSDNDADFTAWQTEVASTSATYRGEAGHRYGFFVTARDGAGNVEATKSTAEQSISVEGSGEGGGGGCTIASREQRDIALPLLVLLAAAWRRARITGWRSRRTAAG